MISTKGRYSIRVLLDLAEHRSVDFIPMKEVAARQDISLKYIERLMPALKAAGLVESVHGIGGGYRLTREPADYTVGEILREAEGTLSSLAGAELTPRETASGVAGVWQQLDARIAGYLDSVLLSSLTSGDAADEYVI